MMHMRRRIPVLPYGQDTIDQAWNLLEGAVTAVGMTGQAA